MNIQELVKAQSLTEDQKRELYTLVANNDMVRKAYIQSRAFVIEPLIQKESQVRNIFTPETLAPGASPYYPIGSKEVNVTWVSSAVTGPPRRTIEGDECWISTFPLAGRIEWSLDLAKDGRFNVIDESNFYLKEQLKEQENLVGWNLLKAVAADSAFPSDNSVQIGSTGGVDLATGKGFFSKQLFAELMYAADIQRRRITDIYMSPRTMFDLFNYWGSTWTAAGTAGTAVAYPSLPQGAAEKIFNMGTPGSGESNSEYVTNMFGVRFHKVYNSSVVGDEEVYAFDLSGARGRFGAMPIRDPLTSFEDPIASLEFKVGIIARHRLGFGVLDPVSMFVGTIDRA